MLRQRASDDTANGAGPKDTPAKKAWKDPNAQGTPRYPGENRARAQRRERQKAAAA
jgi:hypothetical protein